MRVFIRAYDFLVMALAVLAGVVIVFACGLVVVDVAIRVSGFRPPSFTSATVEYLLLYFTMFSAPYLARVKRHVYIDALTSRLRGRPRWLVEKFAYLTGVVTCLIFAWLSLGLLLDSLDSGLFDERSVDIPFWLLYLPMPLGFALVAGEFTRFLIGVDTLYTDRTEAGDAA